MRSLELELQAVGMLGTESWPSARTVSSLELLSHLSPAQLQVIFLI